MRTCRLFSAWKVLKSEVFVHADDGNVVTEIRVFKKSVFCSLGFFIKLLNVIGNT